MIQLRCFLIGFLVLFLVLVNSVRAPAAITLSPSVFYSQEKDKDAAAPPASETKLTIYDIKLGYITESNIYVGAIYVRENKDQVTSEEDITATGASLGYFQLGAYLLGHYFIETEREESGTNTTEKGEGGHQFDLGYIFSISNAFAVGPQLTYKKYTFETLEPDGTSIDRTKTRLIPMINLSFIF